MNEVDCEQIGRKRAYLTRTYSRSTPFLYITDLYRLQKTTYPKRDIHTPIYTPSATYSKKFVTHSPFL